MSIRNTKEDRIWRILVIRKHGRCIVCNTLQDREAHHLDSYNYHPEKRYDVDNGVCLCRKCHTVYHCDYNRSFRVKTTRKNFEEFLKVVNYIRSLSNIDISHNGMLVSVKQKEIKL